MKNNEKSIKIDAIFDRIMSVLNVGTYKDMLDRIDVRRGTFDNWKSRGAIPKSQIITIADRIGVSSKWLELGNDESGDHRAEVKEDCRVYNDTTPHDIRVIMDMVKELDVGERRVLMRFVLDLLNGR